MTEPAADLVDPPEASAEAVVARLGAGRVAVFLDRVAEVGRLPGVTRIPGVPHWVSGVANWRGRLLPVLDLRSLLGAEAAPPGPQARLLVLSCDDITVGVVVDAVEGTAGLGPVDPLPAAITGRGRELVAGQVPRPDGPVAVLDVDAVLRLRDELPRARRSA